MTSYRIHWSDRERLRLIAERMTQDMAASVAGQELDDAFRKVTMSGALRVAIRNLAKELGIVVDETDVKQREKGKGKAGRADRARPYGAAEREREQEQKRARELREARREELRPDKGLLDLDGLEGLNDPDEEEDER